MTGEPEHIKQQRRQLGEQLAVFRLAANLTQGQLARAVYCDRTAISKLEAGERSKDRKFWQDVDTFVQADGALVAAHDALVAAKHLHDLDQTTEQLARARGAAELLRRHHSDRTPAPLSDSLARSPHMSEGDDVQRRQFMSAVAGAAIGLPQVFRASQGSHVGNSQTTQLLARTARLRRLDDFLGGADTYRLYATELAGTTDFVRSASCTTTTRQALTAVIAEQAQLAGWAAFDAGMHREAKQHYLTSLTAAKEANNTALAGNSLAFLAYQQIATDKPDVGMATASYATAKQEATPRVRALLLERMAWTHAVAGQAKETERALAAAAEALRLPDDRPEPDWVFWVDEIEHGIMAGRCWTELKRPLRAVPTLENVLAKYEDTHARDKSMYLTWLAHAYIDAGEVEQAAAVAGRAVELATGIASVRPKQYLDKVVQRLRPHHSLPSVAELLEQVGPN